MESYIEVYSNGALGLGKWTVRYAILKDHILSLCEKKGGKIVNRLHLAVSHLNPKVQKPLKFSIDNGFSEI